MGVVMGKIMQNNELQKTRNTFVRFSIKSYYIQTNFTYKSKKKLTCKSLKMIYEPFLIEKLLNDKL